MSNKDITIQEIEALLKSRQGKINNMEQITKKNITKLKKLNSSLDTEEKKLLRILSDIAYNSEIIESLDDGLTEEDLTSRIDEVSKNMRKIRTNLADIIRKG